MNDQHTSPRGFIDPNAPLLASTVPAPPPTLRVRTARFIRARSSRDLRSVVRWSRSREGRSCFFAALAGVALTLALYRSEASSAASLGAAVEPHPEAPYATLAAAASVRAEPLALRPTSSSETAPAAHRAASTQAAAASHAGDDAKDEPILSAALSDASDSRAAVSAAPRKAAIAKSKSKRKKVAKQSRKAKRQSVARGSSRGARRAKAQRAAATGPLAAWLTTQRSKEARSVKRR